MWGKGRKVSTEKGKKTSLFIVHIWEKIKLVNC